MKRILLLFVFVLLELSGVINAQTQQCNLLEIEGETSINCLSPSTCVTLNASIMIGVRKETTSYLINGSVPCPPPPVDNGIPTSITLDDEWSPVIPLPFTFYFFGQAYNELIIGDNGVVSFDTRQPGQRATGRCEWSFNVSAPNPSLFKNTIFGAYHDLLVDPTIGGGGEIVYYVSGTAPERKFVVDFRNVSQYQCTSLHTNQRIILHESSNVIDVEIIDKPVCAQWNHGNALIAIQNKLGNVAYVPQGRNTGNWGASDELWRFVPNGNAISSSFEYKWYDLSTNTLISTQESIQVCPTRTTDYRLEVSVIRPRDIVRLSKNITVNVDYSHDEVDLGPDQQMCPGDHIQLDGTVENATAYQWQRNGVDIPGATEATYTATEDGIYTVNVEIGICSTSDSMEITYYPHPEIDLGPDMEVCEGETAILDATPSNQSGNETYEWQKDGQVISGATASTLEVNETGTYVVTVNAPNMCVVTDTIRVHFQPKPELDLGEDKIFCSYETAVISANITDGSSYEWTINGTPSDSNQNEIEISGSGEYDIILTMTKGVCTVEDSIHITILDPIIVEPEPILFGELIIHASGGIPPYKYAVDQSEFQDDNHFYNLSDGEHMARVKDSHNCIAEITTHVTNLIIPTYFSPNNDGIADIWRIGNAELMPGSKLYVYDRYGKLIKELGVDAESFWDGTYNGKAVFSDDYWYVLILNNGKVYKGHFSLIR